MRAFAVCCGMVWIGLAACGPAAGQTYLPADGDALARLKQLDGATRREDWAAALQTLELLIAGTERGQPRGLFGQGALALSLPEALAVRTARWPDAGRRGLRAHLGAIARRQLIAASRSQGPARRAILRRIGLCYYPTEAAATALRELAEDALEAGRPARALRWLAWLGRHPDRPVAADQLAARQLLCWRRLGRRAEVARLRGLVGARELSIGGRTRRLDEALTAWAERTAPVRALPGAPGFARWQASLGPAAWPADRRRRRAALGLRPPPLPALLADDKRLYVASPHAVVARRLRDGRVAWQFPELPPGGRWPDEGAGGLTRAGDDLLATLDDAVLCFDTRTGKLRWRWMAATAPAAAPKPPPGAKGPAAAPPRWAALSAVQVEGDRLRLLATRLAGAVEVHLLELSRADGRLLGSRLVCTASSPRWLGFGHPAPAPAVVGDALLLAPGQGAVIVLDRAGLAPRWAVRYRQMALGLARVRLRAGRLRRPRAPVVVGERVYMAPTDSADCMALDTVARRLLWRHPLADGEQLLAAGPGAVLVGGRELRCLDPLDGRLRWSATLEAPATSAALGRERVAVATSRGLLRLELASGAIADRAWAPNGGRLAIAGPQWILADAERLCGLGTRERQLAGTPSTLARLQAAAATGVVPADLDALARVAADAEPSPDPKALRALARIAGGQADRATTPAARVRWLRKTIAWLPPGPARALRRIALLRAWRDGAKSLPGDADRERAALGREPGAVDIGHGVAYPPRELARLVDGGERRSLPPATPLDRLARRHPPAHPPVDSHPLWRRPAAARTVIGSWQLAGGPPALAAHAAELPTLGWPLADPVAPRLVYKSGVPTTVVDHTARFVPVVGACSADVPFPLGLNGKRAVQLRDGYSGALLWHHPRESTSPPLAGVATVGDHAVVQLGGLLVVIELASGQPVWGWRGGADSATRGSALATALRRPPDRGLGGWTVAPQALIVGAGRRLHRLDPETGAIRWRVDLGADVEGPPRVVGPHLFVSQRGQVEVRRLLDGRRLQAVRLPDRSASPRELFAAHGGVVARMTRRGQTRLVAITPDRSTPRWQKTLPHEARFVLGGDPAWLALVDTGQVHVLRAADGRTAWTSRRVATDADGLFAVADGSRLWLAWARRSGLVVVRHDLTSGRRLWRLSRSNLLPTRVWPLGGDQLMLLDHSGKGWRIDGSQRRIAPARLPVSRWQVRDVAPAGPGLAWLTSHGLVGRTWRGPTQARAELYRGWPARDTALGGPRTARQLAELAGPAAAWTHLQRAYAQIEDDRLPLQLRFVDLAQGAQGIAGDTGTDRPTGRAGRLRRPASVDGVLDERYRRAHQLRMNGVAHLRMLIDPAVPWHRWQGTEDLSATTWLAWDAKHLYVAMEVFDRRGTQFDEESKTWAGDVVLFSFDPAGRGGYRYDHRTQFLFWLFNPRPRPPKPRPQGGKGKKPPEKKGVPGVKTSVQWRPDGLMRTYEVSIPWSKLRGLGPTAGSTFGFNVLVLDDDTRRAATRGVSLMPGNLLTSERAAVVRRYSPERFTKITLVD